MTATTEEWWAAVRAADELSFGLPRTELLRRVVEDTDAAGEEEVGAAARISLITSYAGAGAHPAALDPFDWLLTRYDAAPDWFGGWERRGVLWAFRWVTAGAAAHPEVPRDRIERLLDAMAARYEQAAEGNQPVLAARFAVREAMDGPQAAHSAYLSWISAHRTELSDCAGCELTAQARHLAALGRHDEAIGLVRPVLTGEQACPDQPEGAIAEVLGSMLVTGDADRARAEHVRGARLLRRAVPGRSHALHLAACARAGRIDRGLELLESWMPLTGATPEGELWMAAAGGRVLRGLVSDGRGDQLVQQQRAVPDEAQPAPGAVPAEPMPAAELSRLLDARTRDLALRFDARNGTDAVSRTVEALVADEPLPMLQMRTPGRGRRARRASDPVDSGEAPAVAPPTPPPAPPATEQRPEPVAPAYPPSTRLAVADLTAAASGDPSALAAAGEIPALAARFDAAAAAERDADRAAVLAAWRLVRLQHQDRGDPLTVGTPAEPPAERECRLAAARLDGWLSLDRLMDAGDDIGDALSAAADAGQRLLETAGPGEALLHAQAAQLAAVQTLRVEAPDAAVRVASLAAEAQQTGSRQQAGIALARLVSARQLAGEAIVLEPAGLSDGAPIEAAAIADPVTHGIEALAAVPAAELDHQGRRALARLLRLRAGGEPPEEALRTLREAEALLPDGVRPRERALTRADLASALEELDPPAALGAWEGALEDAAPLGDGVLHGSLLAGSAALRLALGDPARAAADLARAVPLLDDGPNPLLAAQARFDLARALLDLDRATEAAETAEASLADVTELLAAEDITPAGPDDLEPGGDGSLGRADVHLAGCAAFAAAEAATVAGESDHARSLAELCAGWHRRNGNLIAEAEAWQLAARIGRGGTGGERAGAAIALGRAAELADAGGDWARAATCRRERATAVHEAVGPEAGLAVVADAMKRLEERENRPVGKHTPREVAREAARLLTWHQLALIEQRARLLALSGRFAVALDEVRDLDWGYRELDDAWSARDVLGLRGQIRAELGDVDGGVVDLEQATAEAMAAGDPEQTRGLAARLAATLDAAGKPDAAEAAWKRYSGE